MIKQLKNRLTRKLADKRGETLVELMASILIGTMAVALLFGSVMASGGVDQNVKRADAVHYAGLSAAENQQTALTLTPAPEVAISNPSNGIVKKVDIEVYGGSGMLSYSKK